MLGLKKENVKTYIKNGYHYYARLLGFRKDREKVLTYAAREGKLPLLARLTDRTHLPPAGQEMLQNDILASNLYMSVVTDRYRTAFQNEYRQPLVKVSSRLL